MLLDNQVRLAPLYDVASALPYPGALQKLRLAMKFGSGYTLDPVDPPWQRLASDLQLPEELVRESAKRLIDVSPDAFATAASNSNVQSLSSSLPGRLADLVAVRARTCADYLRLTA